VDGTSVEASDGKLGKLVDFLFDDRKWVISHLVLDAGTWLNRRRVALPPDLIEHKEWAEHRLSITGLTRQEVIDSPRIETHVPVNAYAALADVTIMDWEVYWINVAGTDHPWQVAADPHVRNVQEVKGYHIQGSDGPMGHVADFVIDDETWTVRQLVIDTRNWWPGKHVVVPAARVEAIDGPSRTVRLLLSRETIQSSPSPESLVTRAV
jgi:sporulation protein YlmC with PRC-barrel domain